MKNKFRTKLIISSLLVLLPMLVGLIIWNRLPDVMASHWGMDGAADGWAGKGTTVFLLPLILLGAHWLCLFATSKDPKNTGMEGKALGLLFWLMPVISWFSCGFIWTSAMGQSWDVNTLAPVFLGLLFIVVGNYLPKCRQNYTMGIKVPWALNNEENWNATHRFAGRVWVIGGVLFAALAFLPERLVPVFLVPLILILALLPMFYSYLYYKKQLAAGRAVKEDASFVPRGVSRRYTYISLAAMALVLVILAVVLFAAGFDVSFGEDSFTVDAFCWSDLTVDYAAIDRVELVEKPDIGVRVSGFGMPGLVGMGLFESESYGQYTLYHNARCASAVKLEAGDRTLVINARDAAATEALYLALLEKAGR